MKIIFQLKPAVACILASSVLAACGGDSTKATENTNNSNNDSKQMQAKDLGEYALIKAGSSKAYADYLKIGLNQNNQFDSLIMSGELNEATAEISASDAVGADIAGADIAGAGSGSSKFATSSTNLIEAGVDEADYVKQNATHIYTTSYADDADIIHVYAKPSTTKTSSVNLSKSEGFKGMFMNANELYALKQASYYQPYLGSGTEYKNAKLSLDVINISLPNTPSVTKTYTWEGEYKTSRRIGDSVYVISGTNPNSPWACAYPVFAEDESLTKDTAAIKTMPYCSAPDKLTPEKIAERMPVDINGNKVNPADCYIPKNFDEKSDINDNITLITKVDLSSAQNHETTCISASAEHVYMSPNALYLAGTDYNHGLYDDMTTDTAPAGSSMVGAPSQISEHTIINKFSLANGDINYVGSGKVEGYINWSAPSFSMNEYNGILRMVTSTWTPNSGVVNMLHTLKESTDKVELIKLATLPNAEQPSSIGKPEERVKGVRFMGDEGYIVTFKQTDPLYKIDLSNPAKPSIKGELQMPGYSAYLHRINDTYLLGVGYAADAKTGQTTGLQTTVFDTSGNNPTIVDQKTIDMTDRGWIRLPVDGDSRAITILDNGSIMRVAVPYKIENYQNGNYTHYNSTIEYDIDLSTGSITQSTKRELTDPLVQKRSGKLEQNAEVEINFNAIYNNRERALIDGDDVYYSLYDGSLVKYLWGQAFTTGSSS